MRWTVETDELLFERVWIVRMEEQHRTREASFSGASQVSQAY